MGSPVMVRDIITGLLRLNPLSEMMMPLPMPDVYVLVILLVEI